VGDRVDHAAFIRSTGAPWITEHTRKRVDEKGDPTGKTMNVKGEGVHFNRTGYTIMGQRYVDAILDRPRFKQEPVVKKMVPGRAFRGSLVGDVSDLSRDKLTFGVKDAPDWLTVAEDGTVSAAAPQAGTFNCTVTVTDRSGFVDTSKLSMVAEEGKPPVFREDVYTRSPAIAGKPWQGSVRFDPIRIHSSELTEANKESLTFSKVKGPDWLEVAADGSFSGTPGSDQAGKTATWTVKVTDADGADTADYSLQVLGPETVWVEGFDYFPDIRQRRVGFTAAIRAGMQKQTWLTTGTTLPTGEKSGFYDLQVALTPQSHKFYRGMLNATTILLDEKRFGGKGKYRLSFQLLGIDTDDAHLFVSLYDVSLGKGSCTVTLGSKRLKGTTAPVEAADGATAEKLAEKHYRQSDGESVRALDFAYDGKGDVLLVISVSREEREFGGGSTFDELSIVKVKD
jgi:hypothetical protein